MSGAARQFLDRLTPAQLKQAVYPLESSERENWHYVPMGRKGVPLATLDPKQRAAAMALLQSGTSARGYWKATTIMSLETILRAIEHSTIRDPEKYYFTIFGAPEDERWAWRVEGHHLSLSFTVVGGELATTPAFFGANPARVKSTGLRTLAKEEDLARELLVSLDAKQRKQAIITTTAPADIITSDERKVDPLAPKGLAAADMTPAQSEKLLALVGEYLRNMPDAHAARELARLEQAGTTRIHFAWAGGAASGQPHYYRVQGPTFLIEYDNTQGGANHIHSVWRGFDRDFGRDLLREHYRSAHGR
jgi:hypothetical protein